MRHWIRWHVVKLAHFCGLLTRSTWYIFSFTLHSGYRHVIFGCESFCTERTAGGAGTYTDLQDQRTEPRHTVLFCSMGVERIWAGTDWPYRHSDCEWGIQWQRERWGIKSDPDWDRTLPTQSTACENYRWRELYLQGMVGREEWGRKLSTRSSSELPTTGYHNLNSRFMENAHTPS